MIQREGVGKLKHMDVRALWLQTERRDYRLQTNKVPGASNLADLGTKAHPVGRFTELRNMLGVCDCREIDEFEELEAFCVEAQVSGSSRRAGVPPRWRETPGQSGSRILRPVSFLTGACGRSQPLAAPSAWGVVA